MFDDPLIEHTQPWRDSDSLTDYLPSLLDDPSWESFKENYDDPETKKLRLLKWSYSEEGLDDFESELRWKADSVLKKETGLTLSLFPKPIEPPQAIWGTKESQKLEVAKWLAQEVLLLLDDPERLQALLKKREKNLPRKPPEVEALEAFLSLCRRRLALPTKKDVNLEAKRNSHRKTITVPAGYYTKGKHLPYQGKNYEVVEIIPLPLFEKDQITILPVIENKTENLRWRDPKEVWANTGLKGLPQKRSREG